MAFLVAVGALSLASSSTPPAAPPSTPSARCAARRRGRRRCADFGLEVARRAHSASSSPASGGHGRWGRRQLVARDITLEDFCPLGLECSTASGMTTLSLESLKNRSRRGGVLWKTWAAGCASGYAWWGRSYLGRGRWGHGHGCCRLRRDSRHTGCAVTTSIVGNTLISWAV